MGVVMLQGMEILILQGMATSPFATDSIIFSGEVYSFSAEHFRKAADTLAYAYALNNMAWEQATMGNKEAAIELVDSAVRCYPRPPLTDKIIETKAAACLFRKEYDSVLVYTTPPANDYLLTLRAQACSYLQMDDSATYYAQLLLPQTTNLFALDDLYYILTHNDSSADKETLRSFASLRADTQNAIKERHGELTKAVEILKQDLAPQEKTEPWKIILLAGLVVGCLFGGYKIVSIRSHKQAMIEDYDTYKAKSDAYKKSIEEYKSTIADLQKRIDARIAYASNSIKMRLDPYNVPMASADIGISSDEKMSAEDNTAIRTAIYNEILFGDSLDLCKVFL